MLRSGTTQAEESASMVCQYAVAFIRSHREMVELYTKDHQHPDQLLGLLLHVESRELVSRANWCRTNKQVLRCANAKVVHDQILRCDKWMTLTFIVLSCFCRLQCLLSCCCTTGELDILA